MAGAGVPVPSVDDGAIVVAPQACFKVESHENGVVIHLQRGGPRRSLTSTYLACYRPLRGLRSRRGLEGEALKSGARERHFGSRQGWRAFDTGKLWIHPLGNACNRPQWLDWPARSVPLPAFEPWRLCHGAQSGTFGCL